MKHQWRIRRQTSPQLDGQQRWDRAYQLLLQWSEPRPPHQLPPSLTNPNQTLEEIDEQAHRDLCQSVNPESDTSANH